MQSTRMHMSRSIFSNNGVARSKSQRWTLTAASQSMIARQEHVRLQPPPGMLDAGPRRISLSLPAKKQRKWNHPSHFPLPPPIMGLNRKSYATSTYVTILRVMESPTAIKGRFTSSCTHAIHPSEPYPSHSTPGRTRESHEGSISTFKSIPSC